MNGNPMANARQASADRPSLYYINSDEENMFYLHLSVSQKLPPFTGCCQLSQEVYTCAVLLIVGHLYLCLRKPWSDEFRLEGFQCNDFISAEFKGGESI